MCELFGVDCAGRIKCNDLLRLFYSNSINHPDGWGLAVFGDNSVDIEKEPFMASQSDALKDRLSKEISEKVLIAHIRKASVGKLSYYNSHPFALKDVTGRQWTLAHNGTVFESALLDGYKAVQKGQSDSERILCCLVDRINAASALKGAELSDEERFFVVDELIKDITPENKINLLIFDNEILYVHSNDVDTLHRLNTGNGYIFSSRALDGRAWEEVPLNTLEAYKDGHLLMSGKPHANTFDKNKMKEFEQMWQI